MDLKKNQKIELTIHAITSEGAGVGSWNGMAVFVPDTAVGDQILAHVLKAKKTHAFAKAETILTPSPDRIPEDCPVSRRCGGCCYRHMSYEAELRAKQARVQDAISRIAKIPLQCEPIIGANRQTGYRNKAQYPVVLDGGNIKTGFFASHSHRVVPHETCFLQPDAFADLTRRITRFLEEHKISSYNEQTHTGLVRHIYLRAGQRTGELMVCLVLNGAGFPEEQLFAEAMAELPGVKSVVLNQNTEKTNVILGSNNRVLYGSGSITDCLCGLTFELSPQAFYQVNPEQTEVLYRLAKEKAKLRSDDVLLDLYCGIGTIGLTMADSVAQVIGVEVVPQAIEDARRNAERNGIRNAEFFCGDAKDAVKRLQESGIRPSAVVLDPPRKGCDMELLQTVSELAPERIIYVSCDPATLARDIERMKPLGYQAEFARPVDLFPRTKHVETVCLLAQTEN